MKLTRGFSFIEVLISLFLLSLLFFGMEGLGFYTMKNNKIIWYSRIAENQMNNMAHRLRAMQDASELDEQLREWNNENTLVLPKGKGKVSGHFPFYVITLHWAESEMRKEIQL